MRRKVVGEPRTLETYIAAHFTIRMVDCTRSQVYFGSFRFAVYTIGSVSDIFVWFDETS